MLSYITNRQYQKLTACLPNSLQVDQPQVVYLPSYAQTQQKQEALKTIYLRQKPKKESKLRIKKKAVLIDSAMIGDCCPACYSTDNISVKYYHKRHICINCRKFLRDQHGNQVKIFLNKEGEITCLGILKFDPTDQKKPDHKVFYKTDFMRLFFNSKSSFVTFAAPDEMIVLIRGQQN